jgi:peroxiredoxin
MTGVVMRCLASALALLLILLVTSCADSPQNTLEPYELINLKVGDTAPGFTQKDTLGRAVTLGSFRGKVVLLDFWATWCRPCLAEMPNIKTLWAKHRDEDFMIVSVSLDFGIAEWKDYIRQENLDWIHVFDDRAAISKVYGLRYIPKSYLLDRNGVITHMDLRGSAMEQAVEQAVGK